MIFEILMAVNINIIVPRDVTPCELVSAELLPPYSR
jgi:hypothetical protein